MKVAERCERGEGRDGRASGGTEQSLRALGGPHPKDADLGLGEQVFGHPAPVLGCGQCAMGTRGQHQVTIMGPAFG